MPELLDLIKYNSPVKNRIRELCLAKPDREVCGLVIATGTASDTPELQVVELTNVAADPASKAEFNYTNTFDFNADEYGKALRLGTTLGVWHSHCKEDQAAELSFEDVAQSKECKLPYILFHSSFGEWDYYDPSSLDPFPLIDKQASPDSLDFYLGWRWVWGRADCYTLLRSYYKGILGIDVADGDRSPDSTEYKADDWDKFRQQLPERSFIQLPVTTQLQLHDVLLMNLDTSRNPHHIAIVTHTDPVWIVHHLMHPRLSEQRVYGGYYQDNTICVMRHKSLM